MCQSGSETAVKAFSWENEQRRIGTIEACRCRRHIRGIRPCPVPRGSPGVVSQGLETRTMTDLGLRAAAPARSRADCGGTAESHERRGTAWDALQEKQ